MSFFNGRKILNINCVENNNLITPIPCIKLESKQLSVIYIGKSTNFCSRRKFSFNLPILKYNEVKLVSLYCRFTFENTSENLYVRDILTF